MNPTSLSRGRVRDEKLNYSRSRRASMPVHKIPHAPKRHFDQPHRLVAVAAQPAQHQRGLFEAPTATILRRRHWPSSTRRFRADSTAARMVRLSHRSSSRQSIVELAPERRTALVGANYLGPDIARKAA